MGQRPHLVRYIKGKRERPLNHGLAAAFTSAYEGKEDAAVKEKDNGRFGFGIY